MQNLYWLNSTSTLLLSCAGHCVSHRLGESLWGDISGDGDALQQKDINNHNQCHWQYSIFIIIAINNQHHGHHLINFIIFYVILNMMFIGWYSFFEGINNLSRAVYRADVSSANLYLCCTVPAGAGSSVLLCAVLQCGAARLVPPPHTNQREEGGGVQDDSSSPTVALRALSQSSDPHYFSILSLFGLLHFALRATGCQIIRTPNVELLFSSFLDKLNFTVQKSFFAFFYFCIYI